MDLPSIRVIDLVKANENTSTLLQMLCMLHCMHAVVTVSCLCARRAALRLLAPPRDRAKERREGVSRDYAYTQEELAAKGLGGDVTNISIEDSKFLGGDIEHTHLVKGLDYALLQQVPLPGCVRGEGGSGPRALLCVIPLLLGLGASGQACERCPHATGVSGTAFRLPTTRVPSCSGPLAAMCA